MLLLKDESLTVSDTSSPRLSWKKGHKFVCCLLHRNIKMSIQLSSVQQLHWQYIVLKQQDTSSQFNTTTASPWQHARCLLHLVDVVLDWLKCTVSFHSVGRIAAQQFRCLYCRPITVLIGRRVGLLHLLLGTFQMPYKHYHQTDTHVLLSA